MAEPYLRVVWTDPVSGRKGYLVIDGWCAASPVAGPGFGEG